MGRREPACTISARVRLYLGLEIREMDNENVRLTGLANVEEMDMVLR